MQLQLDKVMIKYGFLKKRQRILISDVNLDIDRYGIYIIKGKNGSGKTTLAKQLFRKHPHLLSMMLQESETILTKENILNNIDMFQGNKNHIISILEKFDLLYLLDKQAKFLSGGEKRLVSLLRVLFSDKKILVLDEPSNDIDYKVFKTIHDLILYFSTKKAIIIISHDDRFNKYEKCYEIIDKKIKIVDEKKSTTDSLDFINKQQIIPVKSRRHNPIYLIINIIMLAILCYSTYFSFRYETLDPYDYLPPSVYHISSLISTNASDFNGSDAMNTAYIDAATKWNKFEYLSELNDMNNSIEIKLDLDPDSYDRLYPIQYYNIHEKNYIDLTTEVGEVLKAKLNDKNFSLEFNNSIIDYLNSNGSKISQVYIPENYATEEITSFFDDYNYQINIAESTTDEIYLDFNMELNDAHLSKLNQTDNILVEAIVVLADDNGFYDFLLTNGLNKSPFLVRGYQLHILHHEINNFNHWYIYIRSMVFVVFIIYALLYTIVNIYETANNRYYHLLYFYGFPSSILIDHQKKYYLLNYSHLFKAVIYSLSCYILSGLLDSYLVVPIFLLTFFVTAFLDYVIIKKFKQKLRCF